MFSKPQFLNCCVSEMIVVSFVYKIKPMLKLQRNIWHKIHRRLSKRRYFFFPQCRNILENRKKLPCYRSKAPLECPVCPASGSAWPMAFFSPRAAPADRRWPPLCTSDQSPNRYGHLCFLPWEEQELFWVSFDLVYSPCLPQYSTVTFVFTFKLNLYINNFYALEHFMTSNYTEQNTDKLTRIDVDYTYKKWVWYGHNVWKWRKTETGFRKMT